MQGWASVMKAGDGYRRRDIDETTARYNLRKGQ
jgi:hypothetical protein